MANIVLAYPVFSFGKWICYVRGRKGMFVQKEMFLRLRLLITVRVVRMDCKTSL